VPLTVLIFLSLSALASTLILYEYNFEARMYYDKNLRKEYMFLEYLEAEKEMKAAKGE